MKFVPSLAASAFTLLALHSLGASAQCSSYGLDIGDGNTVYINPLSAQPFSFQGGFSGCVADTCTISLQEPSGGDVTCTSVTTDQTNYESVCEVAHDQMAAGAYTIFLICPNNGLEFGRPFTVVNTQTTLTVTTTETVTGTVTPISLATIISTSTETELTTLPAVTTTLPSKTVGTVTIHPSTVVTSTKTVVHTSHTPTTISSTRIRTLIPHCTTTHDKKQPDPAAKTLSITSSGRPTSSVLPTTALSPSSTISSTTMTTLYTRTSSTMTTVLQETTNTTAATTTTAKPVRRGATGLDLSNHFAAGLAKRQGPDGPLTTQVTVSAPPVVILVTALPVVSTFVSTTDIFSTSTVTPAIQTVFYGSAVSTVTGPTTTHTTTVRLQETITSTVTRTARFTSTVSPGPTACS